MVDVTERFQPLLVTQRDVEDNHPDWDETGVSDYLNKYFDLVELADFANGLNDNVLSLEDRVELLEFKCLVDTELAADQTELTTTRNERIVCHNTAQATVTLNPEPTDLEEVIIWNLESSVIVIGPINGSDRLIVWGRYDAPHLRYSALTGQWGLI